MIVYFYVIVLAALAVTQGSTTLPPIREGSVPSHSNSSLLYTLLQVAGFSETCVSGVLDYCSSAQEEAHYPSLIQEVLQVKVELQAGKVELQEGKVELQEGKVELQEVKVELEEVKVELEEGKVKLQEGKVELQEVKGELQKVKVDLQEGIVELQEGRVELQEVKIKLQEVKEELQEVKAEAQEGKELMQQEVLEVKVEVQEIQEVKAEVQEIKGMVQQAMLMLKKMSRPRHCMDLLYLGDTGSGLRHVYPYSGRPDHIVTVYCDQIVDGGGWTVFQRRVNNIVREDFYRNWTEYQAGFGDLNGEFWLGLDLLHELTKSEQMLRVDVDDYEGEHRWAKYGIFQVGPENTNYRLAIGRYSGDAGDSMEWHNGQDFSTLDADHDKHSDNCAVLYSGAWWYNACHHSNLNGYQYVGDNTPHAKGIVWGRWRGWKYSLMRATMMLRPAL